MDERPLSPNGTMPSPADLPAGRDVHHANETVAVLENTLTRLRSEVRSFVDSDERGTDAAAVLDAGHSLHDALQERLGQADV